MLVGVQYGKNPTEDKIFQNNRHMYLGPSNSTSDIYPTYAQNAISARLYIAALFENQTIENNQMSVMRDCVK